MIKFEFCSLSYLNMWLSQDRLFIENLASNNRSDQLKELGKIAAAYRIARNLPLAGDKHKDKKRYEPVLKIINRISGPVEEKKVICLVTKTKKEICEEYNINEALSLTTKFLWFKFQSPILIYDSRARNALKTETGNYENFCKEWKKLYEENIEEIKNACKKLPKMAIYTNSPDFATEEKIKEISQKKWFMERVFDNYLWHAGEPANSK